MTEENVNYPSIIRERRNTDEGFRRELFPESKFIYT